MSETNHQIVMQNENSTTDMLILARLMKFIFYGTARRKLILRKSLIGIGVGTFLGLALPFLFEGILHVLGFGAEGIVPGKVNIYKLRGSMFVFSIFKQEICFFHLFCP